MKKITTKLSLMEFSQELNESGALNANVTGQSQISELLPEDTHEEDNYEEKLLQITRVTKVVKGGKRTSFRVILVVGDARQQVGIGVGHGEDVNAATRKAISNGTKTLINIPLTLKKSIPHTISFSYGAARIMLKPASEGAGIIAGGAIRSVLELSGLKNIVAKQRGSNSILNNAKATILALNALNKKVSQGIAQNINRSLFYERVLVKSIKPILFV
uniref:Small ribosomal subunit protein uS5c n=1 Tax=Spumella sp. Baekdong012001B8 TaxID=2782410 RepID=A0A7S6TCP6_9STRA|nr:ribosomal protein S5 [Spumella sp. Baekdong012001B8]